MTTDPRADATPLTFTGLAGAVVRTVPVGVLVADPSGRIVHANREASAILGLSAEEICRLPYNAPRWGLTNPEGAPLADRELGFRRVMETGQPVRNLSFAVNLPDRDRVYARVNVAPLRGASGAIEGVIAGFVDITREVETERRLREERAVAREYVNLTRVLMGTIDRDGRVLMANRKACELFGLTESQAVGLDWFDLGLPEGIRRKRREQFRRWMDGTEPVPEVYEAPLALPSGETRLFRWKLTPLLGPGGRIDRLLASGEDVTEQRRAEEELLRSRAKYRDLFELESDALFAIERESGRILEANRAAETLYGYAREELLGMRNTDLSAEPHATRAATRHHEDRVPIRRHRRKDGGVFPVEITASAVDWDGRAVHLVAIRDISERLETDAALRDSEAQYRTLVEQLREGVWTFDASLETTFVNPRLAEMLGYAPEEMLGRRMCAFTDPDMADRCREVLLGPDSAGTTHHDMRFFRRDGRPLDAQLSVSRAPLPGEEAGVLVCVTDVTRRREAEERLRETNRQLEATLEELNATQRGLIRQERLSALGEMASGIAHDFNNRLQMILGFADLLETDEESLADPEAVKTALDKIRASAIGAAEVVGRLREFYRTESENDTWRRVDLNRKIELAVYLSEPKWHDRSLGEGRVIEIRKELGAVPPVDGNPRELQEAFVNLIFNAVDAMPGGGTITFRTRTDGDEAVVEVADTGKGMDEETVAHCFEPFFTTKGPDGSGMGLSVVHGILRRHNARFEVESRPGEGTRFRLRFPAAAETGPSEAPRAGIGPPVRPGRILVVDDEEPIRRIIARHLSVDGHEVVEAGGGPKALDLLAREDFDLVLTDRAMPVVTGLEVAAAAKARNAATPVVLVSGFGTLAAQGGLPEGVDRFLPKPLRCRELLDVVAELLGPDGDDAPAES